MFLVALAFGILPTALSFAAQPTKLPKIGFLCWVACGGPDHEAFWEAMRRLGYAEYKNIDFENHGAGADRPTLEFLAAELVRLKVDAIVADSTQSALAAKNATQTIPVVAITDDPVGSGLVPNLARPGGNVTGLSSLPTELGAKQLELLKKAVPTVSRVAVLSDPGNPASELGERAMQASARALGVKLLVLEVRRSPEYEGAFAAMARMRTDALVHTLGRWDEIGFAAGRISQLAMKYRLPAIYQSREFVVAGGLMSYGPDSAELFRRAAVYVAKILNGAKPADLPVEQPTRFELVLNLRTAHDLGLTIPRRIFVRADEVIE